MTSQLKTRLAKLRAILGPSGSESFFPKLVGLSPSWIKKCSSGHLPMTARAASAIHDATGVDLNWLMGDSKADDVLEHGGNPYTLESYSKWKYTKGSGKDDYARFYNPVSLQVILRVLANVSAGKRQTEASCELFEFAQKFKATYGATESCGDYAEVAKEVSLLGLSPKHRSRALKPALDLQNLPAGVTVKKVGKLTIISGKLEGTPTLQKKQPSRKSKPPA